MLDPSEYNVIMEAIRIVSGYKPETQNFSKPELAEN